MAIRIVAAAEASAVAVKSAPSSIPACDRMAGLTAKIYAIDINVVIPAIISVRTLCLVLSNPKIFCNMPQR